MKTRFSLALAVVLLSMSVAGVAQQKIRVKHTAPDKSARKMAMPISRTPSPGMSTAASSKDLRAIEKQTARSAAPRSATKKTPGAAGVKPIKDKATQSLNLGGGGANGNGLSRQSSNPYKGRLKQKYSRQ